MVIDGLLNHDLIGENRGRLPGADMPGRHVKDAFAVDFDVTGFDRRPKIGPERLHRDLGDVRIFLRVWIVGIGILTSSPYILPSADVA